MSLKARVLEHYRPGVGYDELLRAVFPPARHPRAWNYAHGGGPPVCAMPFARALRQLGLRSDPPAKGLLRRVWPIKGTGPPPPTLF